MVRLAAGSSGDDATGPAMHGGRTRPAIMGAVITVVGSRSPIGGAILAGLALTLAVSCTSAVLDDSAAAEAFAAEAASPRPLTAESSELAAFSAAIDGVHSALPPLPVPEPLPVDEWAPTDDVVIGRIEIPAIGLDDDIHQGMELTAINRGPSHWPGTARPGQVGNMVLAGHRTTYSRPFLDLDLVQPGDEMAVTTPDGTRHVYVATGTEVVTPDAVWIAEQTYGFTATTFACHPKGSARERIVVHWQLLDAAGAPVAPLA